MLYPPTIFISLHVGRDFFFFFSSILLLFHLFTAAVERINVAIILNSLPLPTSFCCLSCGFDRMLLLQLPWKCTWNRAKKKAAVIFFSHSDVRNETEHWKSFYKVKNFKINKKNENQKHKQKEEKKDTDKEHLEWLNEWMNEWRVLDEEEKRYNFPFCQRQWQQILSCYASLISKGKFSKFIEWHTTRMYKWWADLLRGQYCE